MERKTPGVYVEEVSTLPASVAQVETAIPAFIGYTQKADDNGKDLTNIPTRIQSMLDYETYFGSTQMETGLTVSIRDIFPSGTTSTDDAQRLNRLVTVSDPANPSKYLMAHSLRMYFANGGGACYIISLGGYSAAPGTITKADLQAGLTELEKEDEPTLIVFPDITGLDTPADVYEVYQEALNQCQKLQDRFVIIDAHDDAPSSILNLRDSLNNHLNYGAAYYPFLQTTLNYPYQDADVTVTHTVEDEAAAAVTLGATYDDYNGTLATVQAVSNEVHTQVTNEINKLRLTLPSSATIAGVYARVDADRGVWKAPANVALNSVIAPSVKITNEAQEGLNVDPVAGKSINAIRSFTGQGTLVWGARTLAGNDNEWRYVPVRRLFINVEESLRKSTAWVVFEPNDANTWTRMKAQIENFLTELWRDGALAGAKPEEAFFVNVGLGTTMTSQDILEGRLNVEIGMAAVRPAEFITLKFSHKLQET